MPSRRGRQRLPRNARLDPLIHHVPTPSGALPTLDRTASALLLRRGERTVSRTSGRARLWGTSPATHRHSQRWTYHLEGGHGERLAATSLRSSRQLNTEVKSVEETRGAAHRRGAAGPFDQRSATTASSCSTSRGLKGTRAIRIPRQPVRRFTLAGSGSIRPGMLTGRSREDA